jgi:hypothetical protein
VGKLEDLVVGTVKAEPGQSDPSTVMKKSGRAPLRAQMVEYLLFDGEKLSVLLIREKVGPLCFVVMKAVDVCHQDGKGRSVERETWSSGLEIAGVVRQRMMVHSLMLLRHALTPVLSLAHQPVPFYQESHLVP